MLIVLSLALTLPDDKPAKTDLKFTRTFDAPVEEVWKAWTDSAAVMKWWGPTGFSCPLARMDVKVGGTSLVCMRGGKDMGPFAGKDHYSTSVYKKVEKHQLLEYIHNLSDKHGNKLDPKQLGMPSDFPTDQRHTVVFKDLGNGKTELTITEYEWPAGQMMEFSKIGMNQCLDKMAASLKK